LTKKLKRAVIKEELVVLTGDFVKAVLLNQFIYWSERIRDFDKFIEEERKRMEMGGQEANFEKQNGWIYKTAEELSEEAMLGMSPKTIRVHITELTKNGWLDERRNLKYKWDRTLQYRVNIKKILSDLESLGYALENYPLQQKAEQTANPCNLPERPIHVSKTKNQRHETKNQRHETKNQGGENEETIPEITTETTSKITTETTTDTLSSGDDKPTTTLNKKDIDNIISTWNKLGLQQLQAINSNTKRHTMLKARISEYALETVLSAIESINESQFLKGQNNRGWIITFDWFVKPNNFLKVLEGNYIDKGDKNGTHRQSNRDDFEQYRDIGIEL